MAPAKLRTRIQVESTRNLCGQGKSSKVVGGVRAARGRMLPATRSRVHPIGKLDITPLPHPGNGRVTTSGAVRARADAGECPSFSRCPRRCRRRACLCPGPARTLGRSPRGRRGPPARCPLPGGGAEGRDRDVPLALGRAWGPRRLPSQPWFQFGRLIRFLGKGLPVCGESSLSTYFAVAGWGSLRA